MERLALLLWYLCTQVCHWLDFLWSVIEGADKQLASSNIDSLGLAVDGLISAADFAKLDGF